jgi:bifunctional ADP-heptose synthase (sugar kinase/adenylyltransferase)
MLRSSVVTARLIGIVGDDRPGKRLDSILREFGIENNLICDRGRPTVSKWCIR